ncbi:hypothetical protein F4774DRAFT_238393 [Daldinia eschscholtzii]|nr:hypothetical protein F4774DRAFT_238393 [Daldinia eschscholtzii]
MGRMDRPTFQPRPNFNSSLSLRTLQSESVQLDTGRLPPVIPYRRADGTIRLTDTSIPPYSPISERSGSSFSLESTADSWENASFRFSPPQTPRSKHEPDDIPRLDLVPPRGEFLKRKSDGLDGGSKKIKLQPVTLPGVYHLLSSEEREGRRPAPRHRSRRMLQTPNSSPEPETEYSLSSQSALLAPKDPIVQWLNLRRRESSDSQEPLSQPRDSRGVYLNISLNFCNMQPVFYREKQQYTSQSRSYCQRPRPEPSPPREDSKEGCTKKTHNNTKYTTEEADYIRFNKYEMKVSWEENKRLFREKFPSPPGKEREVQGIQGVHYRDNQHVPCLTERGTKLEFLPEGHVKAVVAKVRDQSENKPFFSLTCLYPERAMLYDWVPYKLRLEAARLASERAVQKEEARNKAIQTGRWKETLENGQCACCYKPDGDKKIQRASSSREHSPNDDDNNNNSQVVMSVTKRLDHHHPLRIPHIIKTEDGVYGSTTSFEASRQ